MQKVKPLVEKALPGTIELLGMTLVKAKNPDIGFRDDVESILRQSIHASWAQAPASLRQLAAATSFQVAGDLLKPEPIANDPRAIILLGSMFAVRLVDDGLYEDVRNQAVMLGLLMIEESKSDEEGVWPKFDPGVLEDATRRMLVRAQLSGYYDAFLLP